MKSPYAPPDLWVQLKSFWAAILDRGPWFIVLGMIEFCYRSIVGAPLERYSRITPQLHVAGQHHRHGWRILMERGITAIVNLRLEYDDAAADIATERYLHLQVVDATPLTVEQLREGVNFMRQEIARGGSVYVHCAAGVGRAPCLVAAYLCSTGMSLEQAWAALLAVRPFINPTREQKAAVEQYCAQFVAKQ